MEASLKRLGVHAEKAKPLQENACFLHGLASNYKKATRTVVTVRHPLSWLESYWKIHKHVTKSPYLEGIRYPHRPLGPPVPDTFEKFIRGMPRGFVTRLFDWFSGPPEWPLVQFVMRQESLEQDLIAVLKHLGYQLKDLVDLPKENVSPEGDTGLSGELREELLDWESGAIERFYESPSEIEKPPHKRSLALKVELGGGTKSLPGFMNVDLLDLADVKMDLEQVGRGVRKLPFADDSVSEVYSSHCLEHVRVLHGVLQEICRVCHKGAKVTLITPHWGQSMAMCPGHVHTISEQMVDHWEDYAADWYGDSKKMLRLTGRSYRPTKHFSESKELFPHFTDEQVYRYIQNTCHDITHVFEVVDR